MVTVPGYSIYTLFSGRFGIWAPPLTAVYFLCINYRVLCEHEALYEYLCVAILLRPDITACRYSHLGVSVCPTKTRPKTSSCRSASGLIRFNSSRISFTTPSLPNGGRHPRPLSSAPRSTHSSRCESIPRRQRLRRISKNGAWPSLAPNPRSQGKDVLSPDRHGPSSPCPQYRDLSTCHFRVGVVPYV